MPHPLEEVRNTPWGRRVDDDITLLKSKVKEHESNFQMMRLELKANTLKTDSIKADTQWLVDMFRGSKAFSKLLIGLAIILGGIAVIGAWLGWMHK